MKRAIIVHCWDGYPEYCWYPQTKEDLEEKGFVVEVPEMPDTHTPRLSLWLPKLKETIGTPNESLFLIGHSAGCITILRYLEQLGPNEKVGGVILVAGFTDDLGYEELKNFFETPIDFEKIKKKAHHFTAIMSDDDPFVPVTFGHVFEEKLNADLVIKRHMGHFSGEVDNADSITSLPDIAELL